MWGSGASIKDWFSEAKLLYAKATTHTREFKPS